MSEKDYLRKNVLEKRKKIPSGLRWIKSRKIFLKLFQDPLFLAAEHVALYYGIAPEVATRPFLKTLLIDKKIYLPQVNRQGGMVFRRLCFPSKDLHKGAYGIMEPRAACPSRSAGRMDLILVPGVAFDGKGGRLGRGGGYYDRILKKASRVPKFGLCFREQIVKKVPMTAHDVWVDRVITD